MLNTFKLIGSTQKLTAATNTENKQEEIDSDCSSSPPPFHGKQILRAPSMTFKDTKTKHWVCSRFLSILLFTHREKI